MTGVMSFPAEPTHPPTPAAAALPRYLVICWSGWVGRIIIGLEYLEPPSLHPKGAIRWHREPVPPLPSPPLPIRAPSPLSFAAPALPATPTNFCAAAACRAKVQQTLTHPASGLLAGSPAPPLPGTGEVLAGGSSARGERRGGVPGGLELEGCRRDGGGRLTVAELEEQGGVVQDPAAGHPLGHARPLRRPPPSLQPASLPPPLTPCLLLPLHPSPPSLPPGPLPACLPASRCHSNPPLSCILMAATPPGSAQGPPPQLLTQFSGSPRPHALVPTGGTLSAPCSRSARPPAPGAPPTEPHRPLPAEPSPKTFLPRTIHSHPRPPPAQLTPPPTRSHSPARYFPHHLP